MTGRRNNGEGAYTARPGGRWQYRIVVNGQRIVGSGRTKTEAKRVAMDRAKVIGEQRTADTLAVLVERWTAMDPAEVGLRPTTADNYRYLLGAHVVPTLGEVRLDSLTKRKVADLFDAMTGAASTKRGTYAALVKVLDFAIERGYLSRNVCRDVKRPAAKVAGERTVDAKGARAILAQAVAHPWGVAAFLGFGCGLRRGEVLALRWSDIDLEGGVLTVTGNTTRSSAGLLRGAPKTRRGVRQVPVPPLVVQALQAHRRAQAAARLAATYWHDEGLVLTNDVGGLVEPRTLSRAWEEWAKAAGVEDTGTHLGRHYAATSLLASGAASVADVAALLGHDPAVLLNTYATAVAAGQRAAVDVLGASLTAPVPAPIDPQNGATDVDGSGLAEGVS